MKLFAQLVVLGLASASSLLAQRTTVYSYIVPDPGPTTGYSPNGNLLSYTDSINGAWTMQYDTLNRLGAANASAGAYAGLNLTMTYDSFGNRKAQTPSGSAAGLVPSLWAHYDYDDPDRTADLGTNRATSSNFAVGGISYDAGNVKNDGINAMEYDAENRICAISNGGAVTQYLYDAEGRRVAKGHSQSNPSALVCSTGGTDFVATESYILGQAGEQITQVDGTGNWQHSNVYADGKLLATYDQQATGLHFHINDPLGSRRIQVSSTGQVEVTCTNLPFGDSLQCSGSGVDATEHHFTGKEHDSESGNDYFGARYYASTMGRFLSPDWSEQPQAVPYVDMENPQSLNLYGYTLNNPLSRTDQDGHVPCSGHASVTITVTPNGSSMSQSPDDCPNGNGPAWWDFPGWAFTGLGNMMLKGHEVQGAKQMVYGYVGEVVTGLVAGEIIQGVGTVVRSAGGKIVVERVMSRAELEATERTGLLRGGREGTHYVTDSVGTDSALGAQDRLALPNTPEVKVTLELDRSAVSGASRVQPAFGQAGGGMERTATGNVSVKILSVKDMK